MPMPYSHYVLAQTIAKQGDLPVNDRVEYLVGAFMPDIRYFTQQPREKYHFPVEKLEPYVQTETSANYLLGYEVHLLIDEVWEYPELKKAYRDAFPPVIKRRMTRGLQALAFELYCLKQPVDIVALEPVENDLTRALDIPRSDVERAVTSMQRYLEQHDLAAALEMAKETKLFSEERLQTVERVVRAMENPLVRPIVYGVVTRASRNVFARVVTLVLNRLSNDKKSKYALKSEQATLG